MKHHLSAKLSKKTNKFEHKISLTKCSTHHIKVSVFQKQIANYSFFVFISMMLLLNLKRHKLGNSISIIPIFC